MSSESFLGKSSFTLIASEKIKVELVLKLWPLQNIMGTK